MKVERVREPAPIIKGIPLSNNGSAQNMHEYPDLDPNYHGFDSHNDPHYLQRQVGYPQKNGQNYFQYP